MAGKLQYANLSVVWFHFIEKLTQDIQFGSDSDPGLLLVSDENPFDNEELPDSDALLTPLQKLNKYIDSDQCYIRQTLVRSLPETLRQCEQSIDDILQIFNIIVRLSDDNDGVIRAELMKVLYSIIKYCKSHPSLYQSTITTTLLPIVIKLLSDYNREVRKTSLNTLLKILRNHFVESGDVEGEVMTIFTQLSDIDSPDDFRAEAIMLMSSLAPWCSQASVEKIFLPRFVEMCADAQFQVRKACAVKFGQVCKVVGETVTETQLVPRFILLCEDGVWGVRKACIECFVNVASTCSLHVRRDDLIPVFLSLLNDQSRWVRMAAFQTLGAFISTFANPAQTGLKLRENGVLEYDATQLERFIVRPDTGAKEINTEHQPNVDSNSPVIEEGSPIVTPTQITELSANSIEMVPNDHAVECITAADNLLNTSCDEPDRENEVSTIDCPNLMDSSLSTNTSAEVEEMQVDVTSDSVVTAVDELAADESIDSEQTKKLVNGSVEDLEPNAATEPILFERKEMTEIINHDGKSSEQDEIGSDDDEYVQLAESSSSHREQAGGENLKEAWPENSSQEDTNGDVKTVVTKSQFPMDAGDSAENRSSNSEDVNLITNVIDQSVNLSDAKLDSLNILNDLNNQEIVVDPSDAAHMEIITDVSESTDDSAETPVPDSSPIPSDGKSETVTARVHMACLSEVAEPAKETVTHIGSTRVHVADELNVVNGVVKPVDSGVKIDVTCAPTTFSLKDIASADNNEYMANQELSYPPDPSGDIQDTMKEASGKHLFFIKNASLARFGLLASRKLNPDCNIAVDIKPSVLTAENPLNQTIVPHVLLDHYVSMTDPIRAQTVDSEIACHCAYSLPAVAYTLGRHNWPYLSDLFQNLARDMQMKVRRTLAYSLHQLAVILGSELTRSDILPVFDEFMHDVDEVRIALIKHLCDFLQLVSADDRSAFISKLPELLSVDNAKNWRFRQDLAKQLIPLVDLLPIDDICQNVLPLVLRTLAKDRVAQVRQSTVDLLSYIVWRLSFANELQQLSELVTQVVRDFAESRQWNERQMFIYLCDIVLDQAVIVDRTENEVTDRPLVVRALDLFLPTLLKLHTDPVANVRITLARCLSNHFTNDCYFLPSELNAYQTSLQESISALQSDVDADVRYLINHVAEEPSPIQPDEDDDDMDIDQ